MHSSSVVVHPLLAAVTNTHAVTDIIRPHNGAPLCAALFCLYNAVFVTHSLFVFVCLPGQVSGVAL